MKIFQPTISGSTSTTGSLTITGSIRVSEGITGSLFGTSSWAVSASQAISSSYALNGITINNNTNNYVLTATGTSSNINGESGLIYNSATGILEVNDNIDIGVNNTHTDTGVLVIGGNNTAGSSGESGYYIVVGQANELGSGFKNSLAVGAKIAVGDNTKQSIITGISHSIGANSNVLVSGEQLYVYDSSNRMVIGRNNVRNTTNPRVSSSLFTIGNGKGSGQENDLLIVYPNNYDDPQTAEVIVTGSIIATRRMEAPSFTGSLLGTASQALTASFTPNAITTASVSLNTITFTKGSGATFNITINTGSGGGGGVTINNNVDTYLVTATGTANTLDGEPSLTFDGATLTVGGNAVITAIDTRNDPSTTIGDYAPGSHIARDWPAAGGPSLTAGDIVYFSGSSHWAAAVASATGSSTRVLGVVTSNADPNEIVLQGTVTINTDLATYQVGQPIYLNPNQAGRVTNIPPTTSGQIARYVGWVVDTNRDQIYFNPDFTWIQI